jgi:hypothetical protein
MKAEFPLFLVVVSALGLQPVHAQTAPGDPAGDQTIPEKDRSRPQDRPKAEPREGMASGRSLSDKLDDSGGVIKPRKGVDPEIVQPAPAPHPNSTPVIRPPGTPGGPPGPEFK